MMVPFLSAACPSCSLLILPFLFSTSLIWSPSLYFLPGYWPISVLLKQFEWQIFTVYKRIIPLHTIIDHPFGNKEGRGILGTKEPFGWINLLMALRHIAFLYFPDFFLMTNIRELLELVGSSKCWTFTEAVRVPVIFLISKAIIP